MNKETTNKDCIRIDPTQRLCPMFDDTSIKLFSSPERNTMGFPVQDDCPEEHIQ